MIVFAAMHLDRTAQLWTVMHCSVFYRTQVSSDFYFSRVAFVQTLDIGSATDQVRVGIERVRWVNVWWDFDTRLSCYKRSVHSRIIRGRPNSPHYGSCPSVPYVLLTSVWTFVGIGQTGVSVFSSESKTQKMSENSQAVSCIKFLFSFVLVQFDFACASFVS